MKTILLFIITVLALTQIKAQPLEYTDVARDTGTTTISFRHYFMAGEEWINVKNLNDSLRTLGLSKFSPYSLGLGFGWDMVIDRLISGGEVGGLFWRSNKDGNNKTIFCAGRVLFNTGVNLVDSKNVLLYPLVGIGAGVSVLNFSPDQVSLNTALSTPNPRVTLHQFSFLINVGGGLDFTNTEPGISESGVIGIRAGYIFDPTRGTKWYRDLTTVTNGPDPILQGPYIRILIGKSFTITKKKYTNMKSWQESNNW